MSGLAQEKVVSPLVLDSFQVEQLPGVLVLTKVYEGVLNYSVSAPKEVYCGL
jgi:hypothetical protein